MYQNFSFSNKNVYNMHEIDCVLYKFQLDFASHICSQLLKPALSVINGGRNFLSVAYLKEKTDFVKLVRFLQN